MKTSGIPTERLDLIESILVERGCAGKGILNQVTMEQLQELGMYLPPEDGERFAELLRPSKKG